MDIYVNPFNKNWKNILTTNCYAYAIGIDVPYNIICTAGYIPGIFSDRSILGDIFTYKTFEYNLIKDLETLYISYKEVDPTYIAKDDEWKVSLYLKKSMIPKCYIDFHFLKSIDNGIWESKSGYNNEPNIIGDIDPINYRMVDNKYRKYIYQKTLCLKMNER